MWYRRAVEIDTPRGEALTTTSKIQLGKRRRNATPVSSMEKSKQPVGLEEVTEDDDDDEDEIHQFRRVHVLHKNLMSEFPIAPGLRK